MLIKIKIFLPRRLSGMMQSAVGYELLVIAVLSCLKCFVSQIMLPHVVIELVLCWRMLISAD